MDWLIRVLGLGLGLMAINAAKEFFDNNKILIVNEEDVEEETSTTENAMPIADIKKNTENLIDLRGEPTHVCVCGCFVWNVKTIFENGQISQYFLDMECAQCGSIATAPTPIDNRNELD